MTRYAAELHAPRAPADHREPLATIDLDDFNVEAGYWFFPYDAISVRLFGGFRGGGEQQRVAIARALINDPQILIADEPTAHLDNRLAEEFLAILQTLHKQGRTIIIATHDPTVFDHEFVQKIVTMDDGQVTGIADT